MITIADLEKMLQAATPPDRAGRPIDLVSSVDAFMLSGVADGWSAATEAWYRSLLNGFAAAHGRDMITTITPETIRRYIAGLRGRTSKYQGARQRPEQKGQLSQATIDGHIVALHSLFGWCSREYGITNPMQNIRRPRRHQAVPAAISAGDFVRLFNSTGEDIAGARDRALLAFLADTGARLGGVCKLKAADLNMVARNAIVTEKGSNSRKVVFTKYTRVLLELWLTVRQDPSEYVFTSVTTGLPLTGSGVAQALIRLKRKAGISGRVNPHSFRHAFAREYLTNGGDIATLAKLIGHANINTTAAFYAVFTQDELAELHERRSPLLSLVERGA